ncbi:MAG TPA: hypothetical protein PKM70_13535, partial [Clostridia bacterium]|nr:hypothetical protein [Clostridia bacterium]
KFIELYYLLVRMESDILKVRKVLILIMCILSFACGMLMAGADSSESKWIKLSSPYIVKENEGDIDYLYVVGGYHSIDSGTEIWGTANYSDIRLIGDKMGEIVITYENGTVDRFHSCLDILFGITTTGKPSRHLLTDLRRMKKWQICSKRHYIFMELLKVMKSAF